MRKYLVLLVLLLVVTMTTSCTLGSSSVSSADSRYIEIAKVKSVNGSAALLELKNGERTTVLNPFPNLRAGDSVKAFQPGYTLSDGFKVKGDFQIIEKVE